MALKNLMEDIVTNVVGEILKNDDALSEEKKQMDDILGYVLNRIPPRYVTSERGVLHGVLASRLETQQKTDIFMLTYEAIEIFKKRRNSSQEENKGDIVPVRDFPHIIGQVLEESTLSVIPGVMVSLLHNGDVVDMVEPDWTNPYETNIATRGYFHFWPELDSAPDDNCDTYQFMLRFEHPQCVTKEVEIEVDCNVKAGLSMSMNIPIVMLTVKEGVKVDEVIG